MNIYEVKGENRDTTDIVLAEDIIDAVRVWSNNPLEGGPVERVKVLFHDVLMRSNI